MEKTIGFIRIMLATALFLGVAFVQTPSHASVSEQTMEVAGLTVSYKVVLPDGYNADQSYPAIVAFGGGPQTMDTVDRILSRNLQAEAEKRGYIVFGLAAPGGRLYFQDGDRIFPEFLETILSEYNIEGGKFHLAGVSNGGIAALHVAAANPQYFLSASAFPGFMWEATPAKLEAVSNMCVFIYVGENDRYRWHAEMMREVEYINAIGGTARYTVEEGQPHRIETLIGPNAFRLFDDFEEARDGCAE
jgi:predicted peptidase